MILKKKQYGSLTFLHPDEVTANLVVDTAILQWKFGGLVGGIDNGLATHLYLSKYKIYPKPSGKFGYKWPLR